jgi:predicted amidohydrolase/GNAT superfamily N-acetyltransferase
VVGSRHSFLHNDAVELWTFDTPDGLALIRLANADDTADLIKLNKECFPSMVEQNVVWNRGQLLSHQRLFPEGQLVVEIGGKILGAAASLIVSLSPDAYRAHTYSGITDGGYFYNHDPQGDSLYGADVYVHPSTRGFGIGHQLYEARRRLCRQLNLRRIIAGGRIYGYDQQAANMRPEQYVRAVQEGQLKDLVLSFQLREGFIVRAMLRNYISDPQSRNHATFIEWLNPDYKPLASSTQRKVRVAAVQYQVRKVASFEEFAEQITYFVETAAEYRADFVVFPEFTSMQLLSQAELKNLPPREGIARLCDLEPRYIGLMKDLASRLGLFVIAGTHPIRRQGTIFNVAPVVFPDGQVIFQPKIHITPAERRFWGIEGGSELRVINTSKAKIGVLVCYDSEFPEAARYLTDNGAEIIFVPYCTDDRQGYSRVRYCCQARAIENQVYVVTAGMVGNLPSVPAMDIHYGRAAIFTPSDFEFARDGIQAQADSNVETMLVSDLDINDLYRSRAAGSVTQRLDRRTDLFQFSVTLRNDSGVINPDESIPIGPTIEDE